MTRQYPHTWEEAVEILRQDPQHQKLIWDSYLTADLIENCRRFHASDEFKEILQIVFHGLVTQVTDEQASLAHRRWGCVGGEANQCWEFCTRKEFGRLIGWVATTVMGHRHCNAFSRAV